VHAEHPPQRLRVTENTEKNFSVSLWFYDGTCP